MIVKLEFLSLKGCCRGSFESTLVKMPQCLKYQALAHIINLKDEEEETHTVQSVYNTIFEVLEWNVL